LEPNLWLALDTNPYQIEQITKAEAEAYCFRQNLLAEIIRGNAHPDDLLDALQDDFGSGAADDYLDNLDQLLPGLLGD
jgi:hypothetical protein